MLPCVSISEDHEPDCTLEAFCVDTFDQSQEFTDHDLVRQGRFQTIWKNQAQDWRLEHHYPELNYRLRVDVSHFGRQIRLFWNNPSFASNLPFVLLNSVLAGCLWQAGMVCLHGGVVTSGREGIMVMGDSGAGKSSTLGALMQHGCQVLTEDMVVFSLNSSLANVGPTYLRLHPDSATALGFNPYEMPLLFQPESVFGNKRYLELQPNQHASKAVRINRIFLLAGRGKVTKPIITRVSPKEAVSKLLENVFYGARFDRETRQRLAFSTCVHLANTCEVNLVSVPENLEFLPELAKTLLETTVLV